MGGAATKLAPVGLGLRAMKGGAVAVAVAVEGPEPRIVLSTFLATAAEGDRLALEPYNVAYEMLRAPGGGVSDEAKTAIAEGRKRQDRQAARGLDEIVGQLRRAGRRPAVAALLVNRAGWMTDLLEISLDSAEHVAVAEGLVVREALRGALRDAGVEIAEVDEKSLPALGSELLAVSEGALENRLKALGAAARPWRKEQKLACLAAWVELAARKTRSPSA
jgi:hypothetical protein